MADRRVSELTNLDAPASTDLLYVAHDPSGTPVPRQTTVAQLIGTSSALRSVAAPTGAAGGAWLSSSLAKMTVDPSPSGRSQLFYGQEVSVWVANSRYNMIFTTGLGHLAYRYCLTSADPTVAANWSAATDVIGGGAGGWALTAAHSYVYVEGSTIYLYFVDLATQNARVATAALAAPTVFTVDATVLHAPPASSLNGNICVVKDGSTYRMFLECLHEDTFPGEGDSVTWQVLMATSTTPNGVFTTQINPVTTLRPGSNASVSGMWIGKEGATWVALYHSGTWGKSFPTDIYRATTTDLSTDSWTVTDNDAPLVRRAHVVEVDQVADPYPCTSPGGVTYLFWEGADNRTPDFQIMIAPLQPALHQWDGAEWAPAAPRSHAIPRRSSMPIYQNLPWLNPEGARRTGTWTVDDAVAGMFGACRRYNSSGAQNDSIEFDVELAPGTYRLQVVVYTGGNHAQRTVDIDDGTGTWGITSLAVVEEYHSGDLINQYAAPIDFTIYGTETLRRSLRFKAATRNASASGWYLMDHGFSIMRTDV